MSPIPLDRTIDEWAERLEKAARLLRSDKRRLQTLLERDRLGLTPDGMPSGGGERSSGGDRSDPVVAAVLSLTSDKEADGSGRTAEEKARARGHADYVHRCAMGALRAGQAAADAASSLVGLVSEGERIEMKAKTRPGAPVCAERWCEDEAAPGREGRCEPDYRWRKRWKDDPANSGQVPPSVPKEIIDARKIRRQRIYEDGRLVS